MSYPKPKCSFHNCTFCVLVVFLASLWFYQPDLSIVQLKSPSRIQPILTGIYNQSNIPAPSLNQLINKECLFYSKELPDPLFINYNDSEFEYSRTQSHPLIDLIYLQNKHNGLTNKDGWKRTKNLLQRCKQHGAVVYKSNDHLFFSTQMYVARWFQTYGCRVDIISGDPSNFSALGERIWVSIGLYTPVTGPLDRLVVIQTEQMTAMNWVDKLRPLMTSCKVAPNCVIFDFSESNLIHGREHYGELPVVILPITLRDDPVREPNIIPITQREDSYIFQAYGNNRRATIKQQLSARLRESTGVDEAVFSRVKLCISVHFYGVDSGIEFHRLAQHVKYGCLPLYETPGDLTVVRFFDAQRSLAFANYDNFSAIAFHILDCIKSEPELMIKQQMAVVEWWKRELANFDKVFLVLWKEGMNE